jgi:hypothetical protein
LAQAVAGTAMAALSAIARANCFIEDILSIAACITGQNLAANANNYHSYLTNVRQVHIRKKGHRFEGNGKSGEAPQVHCRLGARSQSRCRHGEAANSQPPGPRIVLTSARSTIDRRSLRH